MVEISPEAQAQQDAIHREIGQFIARWANIESAFVWVVRAALNTSFENAAALFGTHGNSNGKMKVVSSLLHNFDLETATALKKTVAQFKEVTNLRNQIAHSEYLLDPASFHYVGLAPVEISNGKLADEILFDDRLRQRIDQNNDKLMRIHQHLCQFRQANNQSATSAGSGTPG